jgi:hypothetical protein
MNIGRTVYWFVAGTLLGVGIAALPSIGLFLLPVGLALAVAGVWIAGGRGLWALPVGFGALPALLIARTISTAPPPCPPGGITAHPGGMPVSCSGPIPAAYYVFVAGFAAIALAGVVWGLVVALRARRRAAG